jgi:predicted HicB family RNase H-like nuclease
MMKHKGYQGQVEYDDSARIFHGRVIGLRSVLTFEGRNVDEIEQAFKDSIDDYIEWCEQRNKKPEKPFSGQFTVRITPELHNKLYQASKQEKKSLNELVTETLKHAVGM